MESTLREYKSPLAKLYRKQLTKVKAAGTLSEGMVSC